jgi:hypothetical protein
MKRTWTILKFGLSVILSLALASSESLAQGGTDLMVFEKAAMNDGLTTVDGELIQSAIRNPIQRTALTAIQVVIDRLVAVVNGDPITESDLLWFLALDPEVPEGRFSDELKRIALGQAIDQQLLYQEAQKLPSLEVSQDEVNKYISELTSRVASESIFRRRLDAVGLDQTIRQEIVKRRLVILQFIEFRFRAFVFVSDEEIQSYYQSRVVPRAQERGQTPPPLDQTLRSIIEKTIIEDKVASELSVWFEEARRRSEIVRLVEY